MSRYLMNAAVIPHGCPGTFTYRLATVADLIAFVQAGELINTIVYPDTLTWVQQVTGQIRMRRWRRDRRSRALAIPSNLTYTGI